MGKKSKKAAKKPSAEAKEEKSPEKAETESKSPPVIAAKEVPSEQSKQEPSPKDTEPGANTAEDVKESPKSPRIFRKKQPVVNLAANLGTEAEEEEAHSSPDTTTAAASSSSRRRFVACRDLHKRKFFEEVLRGELCRQKGGRPEFNRVIYLLGDRTDPSLSVKEWKACALGVLRASDHTDAIVVESLSADSVLGCARKELLKQGMSAAVDTFDVSAKGSPFHKVTFVLTDVEREDVERYVKAKQDLAQGLAGEYKVIALWIGMPSEQQVTRFQAELKGIKERQWPLLTLPHIEEREMDAGEKICKYPKPGITSAELASFLHVHLSVDIFSM